MAPGDRARSSARVYPSISHARELTSRIAPRAGAKMNPASLEWVKAFRRSSSLARNDSLTGRGWDRFGIVRAPEQAARPSHRSQLQVSSARRRASTEPRRRATAASRRQRDRTPTLVTPGHGRLSLHQVAANPHPPYTSPYSIHRIGGQQERPTIGAHHPGAGEEVPTPLTHRMAVDRANRARPSGRFARL